MSRHSALPTVQTNDNDSQWINVEQLIPLVRLENPGPLLRVAGRVTETSGWKSYCYGWLESDNGEKIKFRVSECETPEIDDLVIIIGSLKPNKKLQLELHGRIEGPWIVPEKPIQIPEHQTPSLLLNDFIEQNGLDALGFLVTQTGWNDICTASGIPAIAANPMVITNFSNEKQVIENSERLLSQGVQGIVIARGGGEGLAKIGNSRLVTGFLVEQGVRFYTAMGHAQDLIIIEKHADEVFRTPSDFGHRLAKILKLQQHEQGIQSHLIHIENHLNHDAVALKAKEIDLEASRKEIFVLRCFAALVVVVCIFLLYEVIFN